MEGFAKQVDRQGAEEVLEPKYVLRVDTFFDSTSSFTFLTLTNRRTIDRRGVPRQVIDQCETRCRLFLPCLCLFCCSPPVGHRLLSFAPPALFSSSFTPLRCLCLDCLFSIFSQQLACAARFLSSSCLSFSCAARVCDWSSRSFLLNCPHHVFFLAHLVAQAPARGHQLTATT